MRLSPGENRSRGGKWGQATLWIAVALAARSLQREPQWSAPLAVGSRGFVEGVQASLDGRARYCHVEDAPGCSMLREAEATYGGHSHAETVSVSAPDILNSDES